MQLTLENFKTQFLKLNHDIDVFLLVSYRI